MDQRSIVLDLHLKGLSAHAIHHHSVPTLGPTAVAHRTVTRYLSFVRPSSARPKSYRPECLDSPGRRAVLFHAGTYLSRPCHTRYRPWKVPKSLGFVQPFLRWVPHILSDAEKVRRAALWLSLLRILEVQEQSAGRHVATLDESWFSCSTDHESIWLSRFSAKSGSSPLSGIPADSI
jgi:hypothetical protein